MMITDDEFLDVSDTVNGYVNEFLDSCGDEYRKELRNALDNLVKKWVDKAFREAEGMYTTEEYLHGMSKQDFYKKYDI